MLSNTLRDILAASAGNERPSIDLLREVWPSILDKPMSHRTRPARWDDRTLVIGVAGNTWLQEARRNRRRLHARLSQRLPWPVDQLEFVVTTLPAPPARPSDDAPGADDIPASPDDLAESEAGRDLERLDATTRDLALRIRAHIDGDR